MTLPSILAVDLSNQVYRALYAHPNLTHDGVYTGGLYGVLMQISTAVQATGSSRIILLCDSKPYVRSKEYQAYKQGRGKALDAAVVEARNETMALVLEMADAVGIPVWSVPGYEADDLAGLLVDHHRHRYDIIWSMSNDTDLWQLFWWERYRIFSGAKPGDKRSSGVVHTPTTFRQKFGITPEQYVMMLALMGTHNSVEGIPRVGEKTSLTAVRDDPALLRKLMVAHSDVVHRNIDLITLPHPSLPRHTPIPPWRSVDARKLYRYCSNLGITVTSSMSAAFGSLTT